MSNKEELSHLVVSDPFWSKDYKILFQMSRLKEFVPTSDMTVSEKLNAVSRFLILAGILLYFIFQDYLFMYIPLIGLALVYYVNLNSSSNDNSNQEGGNRTIDDNCVKPTKDNPFMNVLMSDNPSRQSACNIDDPKVKKDMETMFSHGLYRNVNDIWDKNNSQRQFYTNPSTTVPNDRESFMKWCYSTPYVCKDGDQKACLKYEDPRGHGQIV